MCKLNKKSGNKRIDPCMKNFIEILNELLKQSPFIIVACCCGHFRYPMTIVVKGNSGKIYDLVSGKTILRKKRFYKKDKNGYYFIPEVSKEK